MESAISSFINSQTNLTYCTCIGDVPHCANCFFAWNEELNALIFKSDNTTRHIQEALKNNHVAGTILPDKLEKGKIKGIQFSGTFLIPTAENLNIAKESYYNKYPFARVIPGEIWAILLEEIKMTDNTLGFGKKLLWERKKEKL
ncbi:MAG: hypothetical protein NT084_06110 [Bacteroidetes bacterium]|jgi:uncharacterized protein YhbP (UPF0306 family)|nr:hypothetical protein [Bacteroidota bacterium]